MSCVVPHDQDNRESHMNKMTTLAALLAATAVSVPALAQTNQPNTVQQQPRIQDRIGQILGQILGGRNGTTGTLDAEWTAGRFPLAAQRVQFDTRVDAEVRNGAINFSNGTRLKRDYLSLVELEARYGVDRRFTTQERSDLAARYDALIRAVNEGGYGSGNNGNDGQYPDPNDVRVAEGLDEFNRRVTDAVNARRISRTEGTRLRSDYARLVRLEEQYLRDGYLTDGERAELEARLDELDARVGDVAFNGGGYQPTPRVRLDAIARALPASGLSALARAQLVVEHGDLMRLEAAYGRTQPTADDRAYLDRRIGDLEVRVRIRR